MQAANINGSAIEEVGFSFSPEKRLKNKAADAYPIAGEGYGTETGEQLVQQKIAATEIKVRDYLTRLWPFYVTATS